MQHRLSLQILKAVLFGGHHYFLSTHGEILRPRMQSTGSRNSKEASNGYREQPKGSNTNQLWDSLSIKM